MKKFPLFVFSLFILLSLSGAFVYAQAANPHATNVLPSQAQANGKLQGGKMQACLAHQSAIQTRSKHIADMAQNMETKFTNIAQRVEQYYTDTVLPSGKTVSNYNALLTDIQTKQTAVSTAVTNAESDATNFSCSSTDPKGQVTTFKIEMQAVVGALKDYRTSIKNLIVAVHTVVGGTESTTPSVSETGKPAVSISSTVSATPTVTDTTQSNN